MKKVIFLLVMLLNAGQTFSQVRVLLTNDKEFDGIIIHETQDSLKLINLEGTLYEINKLMLKKLFNLHSIISLKNDSIIIGHIKNIDNNSNYTIILSKDSSEIIKINRDDIYYIEFRKLLHNTYPMIGMTLGTPGTLNINAGYHFEKFGIKGSLGLGSSYYMWGYQFNFLYNFYNGKSIETGISLGVGYLEFMSKDKYLNFLLISKEFVRFSYYGLFYHLNAYGLYLEMGLSNGSGNVDKPCLLFQLGYVHRFNIY